MLQFYMSCNSKYYIVVNLYLRKVIKANCTYSSRENPVDRIMRVRVITNERLTFFFLVVIIIIRNRILYNSLFDYHSSQLWDFC